MGYFSFIIEEENIWIFMDIIIILKVMEYLLLCMRGNLVAGREEKGRHFLQVACSGERVASSTAVLYGVTLPFRGAYLSVLAAPQASASGMFSLPQLKAMARGGTAAKRGPFPP